jgi:hypothetical protein
VSSALLNASSLPDIRTCFMMFHVVSWLGSYVRSFLGLGNPTASLAKAAARKHEFEHRIAF